MTRSRQVFSTIRDIVDELSVLTAAQASGLRLAKGGTERKTDARVALRKSLADISQTARLIARTFPRFDEQFQIPRSLGDATLLYTARLFAQQGAPHSELFVRYAMRPTFIDDLTLLIETVEQSKRDRTGARSAHKDATAAINAALKKGMNAIEELDVLVPIRFGTIPSNFPSGNRSDASKASDAKKPRRRPRSPLKL